MAASNRREFFFLNLGHFYDHLFILIYAAVAALVLPAAFDMSYSASPSPTWHFMHIPT